MVLVPAAVPAVLIVRFFSVLHVNAGTVPWLKSYQFPST
jgi:hypothetical protein